MRLTYRCGIRYGFAKNERAAIRDDELKALQEIATELLAVALA